MSTAENKDNFNVPTKHRGGYICVDRYILDYPVDALTKLVFLSLLSSRFKKDSLCRPSIAAIAKRCLVDRRTVQRRLAQLEGMGWIQRTGRTGMTNEYVFLLPTTEASSPSGVNVAGPMTQQSHKQEVRGKKYRQGKNKVLYHGKDRCMVIGDGTIRVYSTHQTQWINYGGGDDEKFSYDGLFGLEAKKAAIADKTRQVPTI